MQHLYFIRHGETQDNADLVWPRYDVPLNDAGRSQAIAAGQKAKADGLHFDVIVASPFPRALETARLIAEQIGFPPARIETNDLLKERDMGELTGTPPEKFFVSGRVYRDTETVPTVETIEAVQKRAATMLTTLKARPEASILVVGHGIFGRAFRREVASIPYTDEFRTDRPRNMIPNAEIIELI
jgi:broad specificity phosphatase PhoE